MVKKKKHLGKVYSHVYISIIDVKQLYLRCNSRNNTKMLFSFISIVVPWKKGSGRLRSNNNIIIMRIKIIIVIIIKTTKLNSFTENILKHILKSINITTSNS